MKDMLDIQFNEKTIPTRSEIKSYCKDQLIQDGEAEYIKNLSQPVLRDSQVWLQGYVIGVASDSFQLPIQHPESVKDFYLAALYKNFVKKTVIG